MRILNVSPYWPPAGGGLERYAAETLARLAARGHAVRALAFGPEEETRSRGISVRLVAPHARVSNTPLRAGFVRLVKREVAAFRPDVVVAHGPVPFPLEMSALATPHEVPFVPVLHAGRLEGGGLLLDAAAAFDRATFLAHALRRAARIVAVSPYVERGLARAVAPKVRVVPPGVDLARFRPGPPPDPGRVLFVGPLDPAYAWKGFDVLYEAAKTAGVHLVAVGDGRARAAWIARAEEDGAAASFPGRLDDAALLAAYHEAGVVVLPSRTPAEAFGMVLAEGAACARPLVASRVGGIPAICRDGENGVLVPPGDAPALAAALADLARSPARARQLGLAGRRLVEREHDWERVASRFEAVLHEATGAS